MINHTFPTAEPLAGLWVTIICERYICFQKQTRWRHLCRKDDTQILKSDLTWYLPISVYCWYRFWTQPLIILDTYRVTQQWWSLIIGTTNYQQLRRSFKETCGHSVASESRKKYGGMKSWHRWPFLFLNKIMLPSSTQESAVITILLLLQY